MLIVKTALSKIFVYFEKLLFLGSRVIPDQSLFENCFYKEQSRLKKTKVSDDKY